MKTPISHLSDLSACREATDWVKSTKCKSLESAWLKCERVDWMLWYVGKKAGPVGSESRIKLVLIACECAELVLPIFEKEYPKDDRPRKAIEAARAYALKPSEETRVAANAAANAAAPASSLASFHAASLAVAHAAALAASNAASLAASNSSSSASISSHLRLVSSAAILLGSVIKCLT